LAVTLHSLAGNDAVKVACKVQRILHTMWLACHQTTQCANVQNNYLVVSHPRTTWLMHTLDPDCQQSMEMLGVMLMYICHAGLYQS